MRSPRLCPDRDERYMGLAFFHSCFSKDPDTQVGAVIVDDKNQILGTGYNGPPRRIDDSKIDWSRPNKYKYIRHAEANAIKHSLKSIEGTTLYVTGMPCPSCMLEIVDACIDRVIYHPMTHLSKNSMLLDKEIISQTTEIAKRGGVKLIKFNGNLLFILKKSLELINHGVIHFH